MTIAAVAALLAAASAPSAPAPEEARAFVDRVNSQLDRLLERSSTADWIAQTYITDDTERNAAAVNEELLAFQASAVRESMRFAAVPLDARTRRMLDLLRTRLDVAAPADAAKRAELASVVEKLQGMYGKNRACETPKGPCRTIDELEEYFRTERREPKLRAAWEGWHAAARPMKPLYERFVALSNEGAREIGFADTGDLWRSAWDGPPAAVEAEAERLWQQLRPFYEQLHCHVRARLAKLHPANVRAEGPMPAHVLGNMWAQDWSNLYAELEPFPGRAPLDVTPALKAQKWTPQRMAKLAEAFFTSLGLDPLPATFWERSMFVRPPGRDVVCHASAWTVADPDDLRIKMCIRPVEEDLVTLHHEEGHLYYDHYYRTQPALFREGANAGFHEAIGDTLGLSVTPGYLAQVGLLKAAPKDDRSVVNVQMKDALSRVAFLPFGLLVDRWRWKVYSGAAPATWNAEWWKLRRDLQGVAPPSPRGDDEFDPGAKYHVPANTSYLRYFLATVYQFQFHRALCKAAGQTGPLHACSIHGSRAAGERLRAMLELGASRPWPDALEAMTGQRQADASALLDYYEPLRRWLEEQNRGRTCGW